MKYSTPLAIVSSSSLILLLFFQWTLVDLLTPFILPFLWLLVIGFFLVVIVFSLVSLFKKRKWSPLLIQITTVLIVIFIPFNTIVLQLNFSNHFKERTEVISKIQNGTLQPNVTYNTSVIHLPREYDHLSKGGGDIIIEEVNGETLVFFYTFRGILGDFSGFIYSPHNRKPNINSFGGDFKEIVKMAENWYFVASS